MANTEFEKPELKKYSEVPKLEEKATSHLAHLNPKKNFSLL